PQSGVAAGRGVTRAWPADMDARLALARFYEAVGQPEDARREYQGILRFRPENSEARTALTRMQRSRKEGAS
ncbi:MAG: tetratricopeptide repeat protein, partial [Myxococcota bacterium]